RHARPDGRARRAGGGGGRSHRGAPRGRRRGVRRRAAGAVGRALLRGDRCPAARLGAKAGSVHLRRLRKIFRSRLFGRGRRGHAGSRKQVVPPEQNEGSETMAIIYTDKDATLDLVRGRKVAIVGYGKIGRASCRERV